MNPQALHFGAMLDLQPALRQGWRIPRMPKTVKSTPTHTEP
jgi:hypothetical protein